MPRSPLPLAAAAASCFTVCFAVADGPGGNAPQSTCIHAGLLKSGWLRRSKFRWLTQAEHCSLHCMTKALVNWLTRHHDHHTVSFSLYKKSCLSSSILACFMTYTVPCSWSVRLASWAQSCFSDLRHCSVVWIITQSSRIIKLSLKGTVRS